MDDSTPKPAIAGAKKKKNPKAFGVANIVRTKRTQQRNLDRGQKKEVVPQINKAEDVPPPALVVVMGPPGCGKSTLIRSLVKIYSGQNLTDTKGPVTVVTGKTRRVTFFECPADICSMTDLSKVADLVLLMIDASYGFEMGTFEFLNQLQLHGFPKVMGILTHLDMFRTGKTLQNAKKALKHRFWTEIYKGAKMFEFMGGVGYSGKYSKHEIKRLALYVSRIKFRPLVWRNTHPYVLVDRVEDVTPHSTLTGQNHTRDVTLYGYVRGTHLKPSMAVHLIGAGDFDISDISALPDPCPYQKQLEAEQAANGGKKMSLKNRKDNLLYAPMANIGRVTLDKDGLYIELKNVNYTKQEQLHMGDADTGAVRKENTTSANGNTNTPMDMLRSMQVIPVGLDTQLRGEGGSMSMFAAGTRGGDTRDDVDDADARDGDSDRNRDRDGYSDSDSDEERLDDVNSEDENGSDSDSDREEEDLAGNDDSNDDSDDDNNDDDDNDDDDNDDDDGNDDNNIGHDDDSDNDSDNNSNNSSSDSDNDNDSGDGDGSGNEMQRIRSNDKDDVDKGGHTWDKGKMEETMKAFTGSGKVDIMSMVYGNGWSKTVFGSKASQSAPGRASGNGDSDDSDDEEDDELFLVKKKDPASKSIQSSGANCPDSSRSAQSMTPAVPKPGAAAASTKEKDNTLLLPGADIDNAIGQLLDTEVLPAPFEEARNYLKLRFVTGKEGYTNRFLGGSEGGEKKKESGEDGSDGEDYGDFEDMQTGEVHSSRSMKTKATGKDDDEDSEAENDRIDEDLRAMNAAKKAVFKSKFDSSYDSGKGGSKKKGKKDGDVGDEDEEDEVDSDDERLKAMKDQQEAIKSRNQIEFGEDGDDLARLRYEGFRQGLYVRILIKGVPVEFLRNFRPQVPVVLGGLLPHETHTSMGYMAARIKRHRWHKRVLKSNDPLIFSVGWRRYQSIPVFYMKDENERERYLKYTPEHMHCHAVFYGPLVPPNTGVLAFQSMADNINGFRISLTGNTLEQKATSTVLKKLKLVGHPYKIFKNTAFISGMFNSALEVSKFEHAKIKTVSGIRGAIKKALKEGEPGSFRATFEDKILMSDLIICRLWIPVELKQYYNPIHTFLAASQNKQGLIQDQKKRDNSKGHEEGEDGYSEEGEEGESGDSDSDGDGEADGQTQSNALTLPIMRTTAQLRREKQIAQVVNKDSVYKPIVRVRREFGKMKVSSKLQETLPFASKPKNDKEKNKKSYLSRRAVVLEPEEKKNRAAIQMLSTIKADKVEKRILARDARSSKNLKAKNNESARFEDVNKEEKKRKYREDGKEKARRDKKKTRGADKRGDDN